MSTPQSPARRKLRISGTTSLAGFAFLLTIGLVSAQGATGGQRFNLTTALHLGSGQSAQLFVPDYFVPPSDGRVMLGILLHAGATSAEDMVYKPKANAVVFNLNLNGLSSVYQNYFADQAKFPLITNLVLQTLRTNNVVTNAGIGRLVLTSFSAGYAGIREILKSTGNYDRVDAILLADSLYSSSDAASRTSQMRDFLRFAADARDRKKIFLLTHSSVATSGYDSTVKTADYLVAGIGATWVPASIADTIGTLYRKCETNQFQVKGYLGSTGTDHSKHLQNIDLMMSRLLQILAANEPPRFKSVFWGEDHVELGFSAAAGRLCTVETSADLSSWSPLSVVAGQVEQVTIIDPHPSAGIRFYRARLDAQ